MSDEDSDTLEQAYWKYQRTVWIQTTDNWWYLYDLQRMVQTSKPPDEATEYTKKERAIQRMQCEEEI